jgi:hypothetical protein
MSAGTKQPDNAPTSQEVRAWAQEKGLQVSRTGTIPRFVVLAWDKAHPVRKFGAKAGS